MSEIEREINQLFYLRMEVEIMKCPKCGKELTYEDYETYYDEENEDTSYYILCSDCGYDESEVE